MDEDARFAPTTASPGPADYLNAYENWPVQVPKTFISIHMSSKISGAYQAALIAQSCSWSGIPACTWRW